MIEVNPEDRPRYTEPRKLADGTIAWYWKPAQKFVKQGLKIDAEALGTDMLAAFARARKLNEGLDAWRLGREADIPAREGTLGWVFELYRTDREYRALGDASRKEYERAMARFGKYQLKDGSVLSDRLAEKITPATVDKIYDKFVEQGLTRQAELAVTVCGIAWRTARRKATDKVPALNPFEGVKFVKRRRQRTTPASYGDLVAFERTALDEGYPELAFAARACWELMIRPENVFWKLSWSHWRPADQPNKANALSFKNANDAWVLLEEHDKETGELVIFYPELESHARLLDQRGRHGALMILRPKIRGKQKPGAHTVWAPYSKELWGKKVRMIRAKAGLGEHVTMESFRHGGHTECGEAGLPDTLIQALSRHRDRRTLDHYVHETDVQRVNATRMRVAYRRDGNQP